VSGGQDSDTLVLDGDYATAVHLRNRTVTQVETISLAAGHSYNLALANGTVKNGKTLTVDGSALAGVDKLTLDGSAVADGNLILIGGAGDDVLKGGARTDRFEMGAHFGADDRIGGGAGNDTLLLDGDYSAGVTLHGTTLQDVETIKVASGHSYTLMLNNGNIAAGEVLTVDGSALTGSNHLTVDAGAEIDGTVVLTGGAGIDVLTGGTGNDVLAGNAGNDVFDIAAGGNDTVQGGSNNDTINAGAALTATDNVDGGTGSDVLVLDGSYSAGLTFTAGTVRNIETIQLVAGHSFNLVTSNATVASGQTLTVDGSALARANILTFDGHAETDGRFVLQGGAGADVLRAGAGNDTLFGNDGADSIDLSDGGNDTATGGLQSDTFIMGAALTASDNIDGGIGSDIVVLNGDYSSGVTFTATTITNVEVLKLVAGHGYSLTLDDGNVASGAALTIDGSALGPTTALIVSGTAEHDGQLLLTGGMGNDVLSGGAGNDTFALDLGGDDTAVGGAGTDVFNLGGALTATDRINGGSGKDTVSLRGDYSGGLTFAGTTMLNVEKLTLGSHHSYNFTTADNTVANGATLTVDGAVLGGHDSLTFDGSAETNGSFVLLGGAGRDNLTGGLGNDVFTGGADVDTITGNGGSDIFSYDHVSDSTSTGSDVLHGFDTASDTFDLNVTVTGVDAAFAGGALSRSTFDADLAADVNAGRMAAGHAVLFTATTGTLHNHIMLVVDANGVAGYQAGADFVFDVTDGANLSGLGTGNFI
jgi:prepilin-type processing-associated H-X9-DG protein